MKIILTEKDLTGFDFSADVKVEKINMTLLKQFSVRKMYERGEKRCFLA